MKLNFLLNNIKRDLNLIPTTDGDKVSLYDVSVVIDRWAQALEDENTLKQYEQRFQALLYKEPFSREDFIEATQLLMLIHQPLIDGKNNVMGVRLRDADYLRLTNRLTGRPVEEGVSEFNKKVAEMKREERERKRQEQAKKKNKEIIDLDFESL